MSNNSNSGYGPTKDSDVPDELLEHVQSSENKTKMNEPTNRNSGIDPAELQTSNEINREMLGLESPSSLESSNQQTPEIDTSGTQTNTTDTIESAVGPNNALSNNIDNTITGIFRTRSWPGDEINPDETVLRNSNPSRVRSFPTYLAASILTALGGLISIFYFTPIPTALSFVPHPPFGHIDIPPVLSVVPIIMILGAIIMLVIESARRQYTWYILTDKRLWVRTGIISPHDAGDLNHYNIEEVRLRRPFPWKFLGIGHLTAASAATATEEIHMTFVPNAKSFKSHIQQQMKESKSLRWQRIGQIQNQE